MRTAPLNLRARLSSDLADLPPAQQRLAAFLLANLESSSDLAITELASQVGVSIGTVSQLCRRFGLKGYQDLRLTLAREAVLAISAGADVFPSNGDGEPDRGSQAQTAIQRVFGASIEALSHTGRQLDPITVDRVVDRIMVSRRVEIVGVGTAGIVAQEAALKLRKLGVDAVAHPDTHAQAMSAAVLDRQDTLIAISPSGRTRDTLWPVREARAAGATVIAITGPGRSPLGEAADIVLPTVSYDTAFHTQPMASAIVEIAIVHAVFLRLLELGGEAADRNLASTARAVEQQDEKRPKR